MARIPQEIINRINDTADIVEIVSKYVDLKQRGRNFFGLCPAGAQNKNNPVERKTKKRQKRLAKTPGRSREKRYDVFPRILLSFSSTRATTERRNKDDCHEQQKQQRSINEHISFLIQIRHE